jgi:hypothetical protein
MHEGGEFMHKLWMLGRFVLPALALASFVGHAKTGATPFGFSSGN